MKKLYLSILIFFLFSVIVYFSIGFYIAYKILRIDHSCGEHEGFLPNSWSTKVQYPNIRDKKRIELRKNFNAKKYHLNVWENVTFTSRDPKITISGWLFNYYLNKPIVIIVHGIFPNGKCKSESNLITSLLVKNGINALSIDLRNYGNSTLISRYENLGLSEYLDVLGAFDFLLTRNFKKNQIGLLGISLGASNVIIASSYEPAIKAIWSESSLAEFNMILKDEIERYGFPNIFGFSVSMAGRILTGVNPTDLNPIYRLNKDSVYFFTHGDKDQRMYVSHFNRIKNYASENNIKFQYWLVPNAGHVDSIFLYSEEYGRKMKLFFEKNLEE